MQDVLFHSSYQTHISVFCQNNLAYFAILPSTGVALAAFRIFAVVPDYFGEKILLWVWQEVQKRHLALLLEELKYFLNKGFLES